MSELPKYEDWRLSQLYPDWSNTQDAWNACLAEREGIITGLEAEIDRLKTARTTDIQNAVEQEKADNAQAQAALLAHQAQRCVFWEGRVKELEKQLAEARAEVAGAFTAVGTFIHNELTGSTGGWLVSPKSAVDQIEALLPESARQAMEQRIADAVLDARIDEAGLADVEWQHVADAHGWAIGTDFRLRASELCKQKEAKRVKVQGGEK